MREKASEFGSRSQHINIHNLARAFLQYFGFAAFAWVLQQSQHPLENPNPRVRNLFALLRHRLGTA